jgi:hypothetical protein
MWALFYWKSSAIIITDNNTHTYTTHTHTQTHTHTHTHTRKQLQNLGHEEIYNVEGVRVGRACLEAA